MDIKIFIDYATEIVLQVLRKNSQELQKAYQENDNKKIEVLETEIIPKYEKLYLGLTSDEMKKKTPEEIENILKVLEDILEKNNFTKEFIEDCQKKREEYKESSGALVVKRLFEYSIKNLKKNKSKVYDKLNPLLKREEKLEADLKEAIQYEDEMKISADIVDVREEKRELNDKIALLDLKIASIERDIQNRWKYEIYGTVTQKELEKYMNYKE